MGLFIAVITKILEGGVGLQSSKPWILQGGGLLLLLGFLKQVGGGLLQDVLGCVAEVEMVGWVKSGLFKLDSMWVFKGSFEPIGGCYGGCQLNFQLQLDLI